MQRKAPFICRFACRSINVDPLIVKTAREVRRKNVNKNGTKLLNNRRHPLKVAEEKTNTSGK